MILNKEALSESILRLNQDSFYFSESSTLFGAIKEIYNQNKPVDPVILFEYLQNNNLLEKAGGYEYLLETTNTTIPGNYLNYIEIVKNCALRRQLIEISDLLNKKSYDMSFETKDLLEYAESAIFMLDQDRYSQSLEPMSDTFSTLENKLIDFIKNGGITKEEEKKLISSGMSDLDFYLNGGFKNGNLYILAARPAMGKTGLGINLATNISLRQTKPVAIFSLEMLKEQIGERIISSEFGKSMNDFKAGNITEKDIPRFQKIMTSLKESPIYTYDKGAISTNEIKNQVRKLKTEKGEVGLVVVDYLQLIQAQGFNRNDEVSKIARDLKKYSS
jgi:replicative DNA helicase